MKLSIVLLISASACSMWGQQPCVGGEHPNNAADCIPAEKYFAGTAFGKITPDPAPAPLKCGKWTHFELGYRAMHGDMVVDEPDRCAPDLHTVTEKEWQELKEHVRTLERLICVTTTGALKRCPDKLESKEGR